MKSCNSLAQGLFICARVTPSRLLGRQTAASWISSQLIRQVGSHVAAAATLQQAVFFGALLCSTSPLAETRLTVYRRSQHTPLAGARAEPAVRRAVSATAHGQSPIGFLGIG